MNIRWSPLVFQLLCAFAAIEIWYDPTNDWCTDVPTTTCKKQGDSSCAIYGSLRSPRIRISRSDRWLTGCLRYFFVSSMEMGWWYHFFLIFFGWNQADKEASFTWEGLSIVVQDMVIYPPKVGVKWDFINHDQAIYDFLFGSDQHQ